jgi:hypothetical protein
MDGKPNLQYLPDIFKVNLSYDRLTLKLYVPGPGCLVKHRPGFQLNIFPAYPIRPPDARGPAASESGGGRPELLFQPVDTLVIRLELTSGNRLFFLQPFVISFYVFYKQLIRLRGVR